MEIIYFKGFSCKTLNYWYVPEDSGTKRRPKPRAKEMTFLNTKHGLNDNRASGD